MAEVSAPGPPLLALAAVTVDCGHPDRMVAFYAAATGGQVAHADADGGRISVGQTVLIVRRVDDHQRPTWPAPDVPIQMHMEFWVDDVAVAESQLHRLGATTAPGQSGDDSHLLVMLDPAGHPFCLIRRSP